MKPKFDHKVIRPKGAWVSAAATDIKRTFARLERERKDKEKAEREHQVTSIFKSRRKA